MHLGPSRHDPSLLYSQAVHATSPVMGNMSTLFMSRVKLWGLRIPQEKGPVLGILFERIVLFGDAGSEITSRLAGPKMLVALLKKTTSFQNRLRRVPSECRHTCRLP